MQLYAHSLPDMPVEEWQPLDQHLHNVGEKAAEFAEPFGAAEWARIAGQWHDAGKATLAWQAYLRRAHEIDDITIIILMGLVLSMVKYFYRWQVMLRKLVKKLKRQRTCHQQQKQKFWSYLSTAKKKRMQRED